MKRAMKDRRKRIAAILLGAGRSRRMGRNKLALPWGNKTVFERCLETLLRSDLAQVHVVMSGESRVLRDWLVRHSAFVAGRTRCLRNPHPERGMSSSIRKGLRDLDPRIQGVLIALGDQPLLSERTINALIRAFTAGEGKIIVPFYEGRRGNPVLFDRCYIGALSRLKGDVGARSVVDRHADRVTRIRTRSEAVVRDMDTWEEYRKLKAGKGGNAKSALQS